MPGKNYVAIALNELAILRQNNALRADAAREKVLLAVPEIASIENEILSLGIAAALAGEPNAALQSLEAKKAALLTQNGFAADALSAPAACPLCKDTGRKDGELCSCVHERVKALRRHDVLENSPLALCNFEGFRLDYYPTAPNADYDGLVPREHMGEVLDFCKEYAASFNSKSSSLLLLGRAGLGKTHLALSIASEVLAQGHDVIYVSAQDAFSRIENEKFSSRGEGEYLEALLGAQLLVLDDLGTEFLSPYILSEIYRLVDSRFNRKLPTIYTTNLNTGAALAARYTEKIASRLLGNCQLLHFFGDDIRKLTNL